MAYEVAFRIRTKQKKKKNVQTFLYPTKRSLYITSQTHHHYLCDGKVTKRACLHFLLILPTKEENLQKQYNTSGCYCFYHLNIFCRDLEVSFFFFFVWGVKGIYIFFIIENWFSSCERQARERSRESNEWYKEKLYFYTLNTNIYITIEKALIRFPLKQASKQTTTDKNCICLYMWVYICLWIRVKLHESELF